jgi:peptide/nickel transport system substrate-binding protein
MQTTDERVVQLIDAYRQGRISRRQLLKAAGAVAGSAGLAAALAACGGSSKKSPTPSSASTSASGASTASSTTSSQGTPQGGGDWAKAPVTFVYADSGEPSHIDPALIVDFWSFSVTRNCYDPLVEIDEAKSQLIPWLAKSWDTSTDGLTTTFHLRDGVIFTDGSKLDADTVKMNLDRTLELKQGPAYLINDIQSVNVVDPMTVSVVSANPDPYVAAHLVKVGIASGQAIKDHKTSSDPWATNFFKDNIVGSGPYKLDSWQHGSQITLLKNDKWWGSWQPGSIDKVIINIVAETASRVQQVEKGEADFGNQWPVSEALRVGKLPHFTLQQFNTFDTEPIFYLYTLKPPFDKKELRQAAEYAFDYKAMLDYYQGYGVTPTGPIPADYPGGAKDLQPFAQDLDKSKALLQQSGVDLSSLNVDFVLGGPGGDQFEAGATILQSSLKKVGVNMTIRKVPNSQWADLYTKPETAGNVTDLIQSPFTLDPTQFLAFYLPDNFYNMARMNDAGIVSQIQAIRTTLDETKRNQLLLDVQHSIRDAAPCIWGCRPKTLVAVPDYVDGYVMQATDYRWVLKFQPMRIKAH